MTENEHIKRQLEVYLRKLEAAFDKADEAREDFESGVFDAPFCFGVIKGQLDHQRGYIPYMKP
jgi:hypothetical protein